MIHGPDIPGSCAVLFFTASDYFHHETHLQQALLLPWLGLCIASGAVSLLFSSSMLCTYRPGEAFLCHIFLCACVYVISIFLCYSFLPFHSVCGVLQARILKWFAIPFSSGARIIRALHRNLPVWRGCACHSS